MSNEPEDPKKSKDKSKKLDLQAITSKISKVFEKANPGKSSGIGTGSKLATLDDCVEMPEWWQTATGTKGLPFGNLVILAGKTDTGKSTSCLEAIKSAQRQGIAVLYVESEFKTKTEDLVNVGIDPDNMMIVQEKIAEKAYDKMFMLWDGFKDAYPDEKLLVIIDSLGNLISTRDSELDLADNSSPGGHGKVNRRAINKMIAKMNEDNVALLVITYIYSQMGAPGVVIAGGDILGLASVLTYITRRMGWVERTKDGKKVRVGSKFKWTLQKNHISKSKILNKEVILQMSDKGMEVVGSQDDSQED